MDTTDEFLKGRNSCLVLKFWKEVCETPKSIFPCKINCKHFYTFLGPYINSSGGPAGWLALAGRMGMAA